MRLLPLAGVPYLKKQNSHDFSRKFIIPCVNLNILSTSLSVVHSNGRAKHKRDPPATESFQRDGNETLQRHRSQSIVRPQLVAGSNRGHCLCHLLASAFRQETVRHENLTTARLNGILVVQFCMLCEHSLPDIPCQLVIP